VLSRPLAMTAGRDINYLSRTGVLNSIGYQTNKRA
jgi:hypothetical protein